MGTPAFAVPSLEVLADATDLVGVVTQPDKPKGRGLATAPPPVATAAIARGVPVIQPATLRAPGVGVDLAGWRPDLIVVAAYGKILPRVLLDLPPLGAFNVHASLLPRHRGAAPVAAAILAQDALTGVTIMAMNEKMDAGDILLQRTTPIAIEDTTETLTARLAVLGARTLARALELLRGRGLVPVPQDTAGVTYAPRLTKEEGRVAWTDSAGAIERKVRAFTPWPSAFTSLRGKTVKILSARVGGSIDVRPRSAPRNHRADREQGSGASSDIPPRSAAAASGPEPPLPGTIVDIGDAIAVQTGDGVLHLFALQMEGKNALAASAFSAGARLAIGQRFDG